MSYKRSKVVPKHNNGVCRVPLVLCETYYKDFNCILRCYLIIFKVLKDSSIVPTALDPDSKDMNQSNPPTPPYMFQFDLCFTL